MHLFLLTDIFGLSPSIKTLQQKFSLLFDKVSVLDPYQGAELHFDSEPQAYSEFINLSGHEQYFQNCRDQILPSKELKCLLGFSAGASVCWRLSELLNPQSTQQIIAFYPSQIRNYLNLKPTINTTVIFPKTESLFSVQECLNQLQLEKNVSCHQSQYSHGFMNPASIGYSATAEFNYSSLITQTNFFNDPNSILSKQSL